MSHRSPLEIPCTVIVVAVIWTVTPFVAHVKAVSLTDFNARFRNGKPSNNLEEAGVLVHVIHDAGSDEWKPWLPCPETWCHPPRKFFSCSVINANLQAHGAKEITTFGMNHPLGFIVSPKVNHLSCSYPVDGGSYDQTCTKPGQNEKNCVPGCRKISFPPTELEKMLDVHAKIYTSSYNEVVLTVDQWVASLPDTIEAVFFSPRCGACRTEAEHVHKEFLQRFSLSSCDVPLLSFDSLNWKEPFKVVSVCHV